MIESYKIFGNTHVLYEWSPFSRQKTSAYIHDIPKIWKETLSSWIFILNIQLHLGQSTMEIEDFTEDQFYQEEIPIIEIPENVFGNLIQLEQPNVFNEFELPQEICEEDIWEENVEIAEHPDIFKETPHYFG